MVFYFPALYAMLPEMFSESRLQKANGWIGGVTFIGSVSGAIAGTVLVSRNGNNLDSACWLFGIFSLIGIYGAVKIPPVISLVLKKKELLYPCKTTLKRAFYELTCTPSRLLAVLGDNFFLAMGAALLLLLIPFARMDDQGPGSFMDVVLLQA